MEILLQILATGFSEIALGILAEIMFEGILYSLLVALNKDAIRRTPLLAGGGYFFWGGLIGLLSLTVFSEWTYDTNLSIVFYIIITPLLAGFILEKLGKYREKNGKKRIRLDSFTYGSLFGLGFVIVRLSSYFLTNVCS